MARPRIPKCSHCGASLSGARTVIDSQWTCPACAYKHDYPEKEVQPVKRVRAAPIQEETLFPLPTKRER